VLAGLPDAVRGRACLCRRCLTVSLPDRADGAGP